MKDLTALAQSYPELTVSIKLSDLMEFGRSLKEELLDAINNSQAETQPQPDEFLSREEVMQILGVSPATLWRWKKSGYLVPSTIGSMDRYTRSSLDKVLSKKGGAL